MCAAILVLLVDHIIESGYGPGTFNVWNTFLKAGENCTCEQSLVFRLFNTRSHKKVINCECHLRIYTMNYPSETLSATDTKIVNYFW